MEKTAELKINEREAMICDVYKDIDGIHDPAKRLNNVSYAKWSVAAQLAICGEAAHRQFSVGQVLYEDGKTANIPGSAISFESGKWAIKSGGLDINTHITFCGKIVNGVQVLTVEAERNNNGDNKTKMTVMLILRPSFHELLYQDCVPVLKNDGIPLDFDRLSVEYDPVSKISTVTLGIGA
jgi:hypothetical protein